eukprot:COSAG06_NODE_2441_length_6871_cov_9.359716_10_plen_98_part_00
MRRGLQVQELWQGAADERRREGLPGARRLPLRPLCGAVPLALPLAISSVPLDVRPRFTSSLVWPPEALDLKSADPLHALVRTPQMDWSDRPYCLKSI